MTGRADSAAALAPAKSNIKSYRTLVAAFMAVAVLWLLALPRRGAGERDQGPARVSAGARSHPKVDPDSSGSVRLPSAREPPSFDAVGTPPSASQPDAATDQGVLGPKEIEQLVHVFDAEVRSASADAAESRIEAAFRQPDAAPDLLKSVSCHQSVCKVSLDWSPDRMFGYLAVATVLAQDFGPGMGFVPVGVPDAQNRREMAVYFRRRATVAPEQAE